MRSILLTAFEPYDIWSTNSSWMALVEFTKDLPSDLRIVTRRYPVDFDQVRSRLEKDLSGEFDFAIHLGQAPGAGCIKLESIGINVRGSVNTPPERYGCLMEGGPTAYRSRLPLGDWVSTLREAGIPAVVSYHAGEYLCNATLYLSHFFAQKKGLATQSAFVHLPLDPSQTSANRPELASMPVAIAARAVRLMIDSLRAGRVRRASELA